MRKPLSPLKAVAKKYQQKATYSATSGLYTLMWGEKPKRGRKKKYEPYVYSLINFTFVGSFTHFLLRAIFIVLPSFCWSS